MVKHGYLYATALWYIFYIFSNSIHSILVHLSRSGAQVSKFAPDINQMHVINHTKGQPEEAETRYSLTHKPMISGHSSSACFH